MGCGPEGTPRNAITVDASTVDQMRGLGATPEAIAKAQALAEANHRQQAVNVWPENHASLAAFLGVSTQWLYVMGDRAHRIGFCYAGLQAWLNNMVPGRVKRQRIFRDLLVMERAVLQAQQELAEKEG